MSKCRVTKESSKHCFYVGLLASISALGLLRNASQKVLDSSLFVIVGSPESSHTFLSFEAHGHELCDIGLALVGAFLLGGFDNRGLDRGYWVFSGLLLDFAGFFLFGFLFLFWLFDEVHDDEEIVVLDSDVGEDVGVISSLAFEDNLLRVNFKPLGLEDLFLEVQDLGERMSTVASESISTLITSPLRVLTVSFITNLKIVQIFPCTYNPHINTRFPLPSICSIDYYHPIVVSIIIYTSS